MFIAIFEHLAEDIAKDLQNPEDQARIKALLDKAYNILPYEAMDAKVEKDGKEYYLIIGVISSTTKHSKKPLRIKINENSMLRGNTERVEGALKQ